MTGEWLKILVICLLSAVVILYLRKSAPEQAFLCALAAGAVILWMTVRMVSALFGSFSALLTAQTERYFKVAIKALGIGYLTAFAADTCRDFGQSALAAKAELAGKCAVFLLCLPLLSELLGIALNLTKL